MLKTILNDVGWSKTEVFNVINGLSKNEMTPARACELLDKPAEIFAPKFDTDIDAVACNEISQQLGRFILANIRPDRDDACFRRIHSFIAPILSAWASALVAFFTRSNGAALRFRRLRLIGSNNDSIKLIRESCLLVF